MLIRKAVWFKDPSSGLTRWVLADNDNCPPDIQQEIAYEVCDRDVQETDGFRASNGKWYRWSSLSGIVKLVCPSCGLWIHTDMEQLSKCRGQINCPNTISHDGFGCRTMMEVA